MTASIEYAVSVLNVPHIIICGHTDCGAMEGAMNRDSVATLPHVRAWLTFSEAAVRTIEVNHSKLGENERLDALIKQNVLLQLKRLESHPCVVAGVAGGSLAIHGWVYNIAGGEVSAYDETGRAFAPLNDDQSEHPA